MIYLHNVTTRLRVCIDTVDSCLDQLLLEVTQLLHVIACLLHFDLGVSAYDTEASAGCVKEASVKLGKDIRHLATVIVSNHCVAHTESVQIGVQTLQTFLFQIVCDDGTCVLH